jgi:hypothetical protein
MYVDRFLSVWILAGNARGTWEGRTGFMEIVRLPAGRLRGERLALRDGAATTSTVGPLRLVLSRTAFPPFCAGCAAPIDYGTVIRGTQVFCSLECSLGGDHPA